MNFRHFLAAAALAAVSGASFGQVAPTPAMPSVEPAPRGTHTPVIDKQEHNQQNRIQAGKQSGELTRHEARRLHAEQKAVDRAQKKAAADGSVSTQERRRIRHLQNRADKDIYRQKHDGASKPVAPSVPAHPAPVQ